MSAPSPVTRAIQPFDLVIFGASGDLTRRKLVPALFGLFKEKALPDAFGIIGFARREKSDGEFRDEMREGVEKYSRFARVGAGDWEAFAPQLSYHVGNFDDDGAFAALARRLQERNRLKLFYLATAPEFFSVVVDQLCRHGLVGREQSARVVVEKPIGHDTASAGRLVGDLQQCMDESSIYRIDHYLGKETVQNLLYFRFANSIFEPIWNRSMIDNVQITVAEKEGVGTRGGYYDGVGALRDMVQNHVLQLFTLTAMEPPGSFNSEAIRDEKVKVLKSVATPKPEEVGAMVVRAQYEGYRGEDRVGEETMTESFVAMKLMIDNWRWAGVPFYVRTGKCLPVKASEISVVFRRPPLSLFPTTEKDAVHHTVHRNRLHIRLQPEEGIHMTFNAKLPGQTAMGSVDMDFAYKTKFGSYSPEAYERLLHDFITGDSTLFTRADEVLEAWRIVDAVRAGWEQAPMGLYRKGSWGPVESDQLLKADGNAWVALAQRAAGQGDGEAAGGRCCPAPDCPFKG